MILQDGTGNGHAAKVTDQHMLRVYAQVEEEISYQSEVHGDAYVWTASKDIGATDCILWLRNDSTIDNLIIQTILVSVDASGSFFIYCPTGTTPDGDVITGVNLNRQSGKLADATSRLDATGTTPANYIHYGHALADQNVVLELHGSLILGYLDEVAIDITDEPGLAQATIFGYFHTVD